MAVIVLWHTTALFRDPHCAKIAQGHCAKIAQGKNLPHGDIQGSFRCVEPELLEDRNGDAHTQTRVHLYGRHLIITVLTWTVAAAVAVERARQAGIPVAGEEYVQSYLVPTVVLIATASLLC